MLSLITCGSDGCWELTGCFKINYMSKETRQKKIYVLDTSVILYNHSAINNFGDNDVVIPITVLEELDRFKKGNDTKNFEAREFIRFVDEKSNEYSLQEWQSLGEGKGRFKVSMYNQLNGVDAEKVFGVAKEDHKILNAALSLQKQEKDKQVVMVSKDINLRLKAKALNIHAEDYETGKIKDLQNLYTGKIFLEDVNPEIVTRLFNEESLPAKEVSKEPLSSNQYLIIRSMKNSVLGYYNVETDMIEKIEKRNTFGITPRNAEQTFALHAVMNPSVKLVSIQGVAGTGKTLLALAGALEQRREYKQIFLARPIVPLGNKDIGYLPGEINAKIAPYMEPLWDNLKFIRNQFGENSKENKQIEQMLEDEKLLVSALAYIRGRSLSDIVFIVDEAQNLTPHEVKTIITRAGENTKIIFTGDIFQIDTPYLDSQSNGLSYLIDRLKGNRLFAHITLEKGERSELANLANELL